MVEPPTIDAPRLRKELEFITAHPERWNQGTWLQATSCGTVGCLAGNTALHAGYVPIWADPTFVVVGGTHASFVARVDETGELGARRSVRAVATELLGLTERETSELFYLQNTLHDLWSLAARFTGGEVEVPVAVRVEHARRLAEDPTYSPRFR